MTKEQETKLTVTFSELDIASDAFAYLNDHYDVLEKDLKDAKCYHLLKDLRESQKTLHGLKQKVDAAQDELLGDEFK